MRHWQKSHCILPKVDKHKTSQAPLGKRATLGPHNHLDRRNQSMMSSTTAKPMQKSCKRINDGWDLTASKHGIVSRHSLFFTCCNKSMLKDAERAFNQPGCVPVLLGMLVSRSKMLASMLRRLRKKSTISASLSWRPYGQWQGNDGSDPTWSTSTLLL